jgi:GntR family transcriptional regulator
LGSGPPSTPAKDLAAVLGVNTNTVLRSLSLLRDEGLLEFRRGRDISVAGTPERGAIVQRARELIAFARSQGYQLDELVEIIEQVG